MGDSQPTKRKVPVEVVVIGNDGESELANELKTKTLIPARTQEEHRQEAVVAGVVAKDPELEKLERRAFIYSATLKALFVLLLLAEAVRILLRLTPSILT